MHNLKKAIPPNCIENRSVILSTIGFVCAWFPPCVRIELQNMENMFLVINLKNWYFALQKSVDMNAIWDKVHFFPLPAIKFGSSNQMYIIQATEFFHHNFLKNCTLNSCSVALCCYFTCSILPIYIRIASAIVPVSVKQLWRVVLINSLRLSDAYKRQ